MCTEDRKLLVIDDDETFREILARSLRRENFNVITAGTPADGLSACRAHDPEYILLDLNLAGQSGLNLVQPLLEISPGARIVILTGYASIQTAVTALKLGAAQYLPKPARVIDIIKVLTEDTLDIPDYHGDADRLTVQHLEWEYIQRILAEHDGNITATAKALKMHRRTLQRKLLKKRPTTPTGCVFDPT
jgi:two-component system, response regulator RegA